MNRMLLIIGGWLFLGLAILGIILPLLPCTPFLLLATWCFARSSPRLHNWLLYRSQFSPALLHWQQHRALPPNVKWKAVLVTFLSFAVSLWLVEALWLKLLLLTILSILLFFMWRLPVTNLSRQK